MPLWAFYTIPIVPRLRTLCPCVARQEAERRVTARQLVRNVL